MDNNTPVVQELGADAPELTIVATVAKFEFFAATEEATEGATLGRLSLDKSPTTTDNVVERSMAMIQAGETFFTPVVRYMLGQRMARLNVRKEILRVFPDASASARKALEVHVGKGIAWTVAFPPTAEGEVNETFLALAGEKAPVKAIEASIAEREKAQADRDRAQVEQDRADAEELRRLRQEAAERANPEIRAAREERERAEAQAREEAEARRLEEIALKAVQREATQAIAFLSSDRFSQFVSTATDENLGKYDDTLLQASNAILSEKERRQALAQSTTPEAMAALKAAAKAAKEAGMAAAKAAAKATGK